MNEHKTSIIVTNLMGRWFQAECKTCGWLSPRSHQSRAAAECDATEHKESQP